MHHHHHQDLPFTTPAANEINKFGNTPIPMRTITSYYECRTISCVVSQSDEFDDDLNFK